jgi:hypothetical protein
LGVGGLCWGLGGWAWMGGGGVGNWEVEKERLETERKKVGRWAPKGEVFGYRKVVE